MTENHNRKMKQNEPEKSYELGYTSGYVNGYIIGYEQGYKYGSKSDFVDQLGSDQGHDHISDTEYSHTEDDYESHYGGSNGYSGEDSYDHDFESDFGGSNGYDEDDYEHDFESDFGGTDGYSEDDFESDYCSSNISEWSGFTMKNSECFDFLEKDHGRDRNIDSDYCYNDDLLEYHSGCWSFHDPCSDNEYGYDDYWYDYESDYGYCEETWCCLE